MKKRSLRKMEEKIAMLMSLILVVLISNFTLNMVAAESYCHGQCRVLVNACKRLILRQSPTAECCLRIRRTPMWCICSIITPQLAALVNANDVSDAVGVICQCGRPTIDDKVKALLEERLKDLRVGKIPENNDNPSPPLPVVQTQKKSVSIPALAATPGKVFGPKKNLAKELDKESGVRRTLDEEFGSVTKATDLDSQPLDFVVISPAKATKDDKDAKKKKAAQADAAFKRKKRLRVRRKKRLRSDVEGSELVRSAIIKEYQEKSVQLTPKGFSKAAVSSPAVFPYVGENGTTCMRKNVTPSSVIYDPLAPVGPVLLEKLMQHIKGSPPKPPALADKPAVLSTDHEGDFYSILIHER
ncbi:hypothetical protein HID58_087061, partial [Brassica napus]